MILVMNQPGD